MKRNMDPRELGYGALCALRGTKIFFTRPRLWPYALPPLICVLVLYTAVLFAVIYWVAPWFRGWAEGLSFPGWLSWLQSVVDWFLAIFFWGVVPLILFFLTGTLYEMFGNLMFDILVDRFEREAFPEHPAADRTCGRTVLLTAGFVFLTVISYLLYFLIFFWIPIVSILFRSAICGRSYLHDSSIRQGLPVPALRKQVSKNMLSVLGFGITARFLEAIPFLIPGLVIGGSILYHTRLFDGTEKLPASKRQDVLNA